MNLRASTTVIESYRLFAKTPEHLAFITEEEIIATIRGEFHPTPKMMVGQAFGRCLEKPGKYRTDFGGYIVPVRVGDTLVEYRFDDETMDPCLAEFDRQGVFEAKATKEYGDVTVVAKADQIVGTAIIENKATLGAYHFDKYAESYQWRFMLDLFEGATSVTYKIFMLSEDRKIANEYFLRGIETVQPFFPYAGLHKDCEDLLREFREYAAGRGLIGGLQDAAAKWGEGGTRWHGSVKGADACVPPEAAQL